MGGYPGGRREGEYWISRGVAMSQGVVSIPEGGYRRGYIPCSGLNRVFSSNARLKTTRLSNIRNGCITFYSETEFCLLGGGEEGG